jgi:hypothetical protein
MLAWFGSLLVSLLPHTNAPAEVKAQHILDTVNNTVPQQAADLWPTIVIDGTHFP